MKISKADLLALQLLIKDKTISSAKIKNKKIIEGLLLNGSIAIQKTSAKREKILLKKERNIFFFLQNHNYHIKTSHDITLYISKILEQQPTRQTIQKWHKNTKVKRSQSLQGLYISSPIALDLYLEGESFKLHPFVGSAQFIFYTQHLSVPDDITIVGVENYQVVWFASYYKHLFPEKKVLFVVRNSFMLEWIKNITNKYIHFGDLDLAAINIYISQILPRATKVKEISFFIPNNIEQKIKDGNPLLYEKQKTLKLLELKDPLLQNVVQLIKKYKKGYEQEGLAKEES